MLTLHKSYVAAIGLDQLLTIILWQLASMQSPIEEPFWLLLQVEGFVALLGGQCGLPFGCVLLSVARATGKAEQQSGEPPPFMFAYRHFCLTNTLMGDPVSVQFSRILFSRKRL